MSQAKLLDLCLGNFGKVLLSKRCHTLCCVKGKLESQHAVREWVTYFWQQKKVQLDMRGCRTKWNLMSFHATSQKAPAGSPARSSLLSDVREWKLLASASPAALSGWSWLPATCWSARDDAREKAETDIICLTPTQNQQKYITSGNNQL